MLMPTQSPNLSSAFRSEFDKLDTAMLCFKTAATLHDQSRVDANLATQLANNLDKVVAVPAMTTPIRPEARSLVLLNSALAQAGLIEEPRRRAEDVLDETKKLLDQLRSVDTLGHSEKTQLREFCMKLGEALTSQVNEPQVGMRFPSF